MKLTIASTLLALALPLVAQDTQEPKVSSAEAMFYKAYYLEKGDRKFEEAVVLYQAFLAKAPEHKLAAVAAKQNFRLLDRMGKTKERDAFKAKFEKLIGKVTTAGNRRPARPGRGEGNNDGGNRRGQRGQGGRRGGMRGMMTLLRGDTKIADLNEEQMTQLKEGLAGSAEMIDRMRRFLGDEAADKIEKASTALKTAIDAGKTEEAQKALESLKKAFPQRGRRGGGNGAGGRRRGGGEGNGAGGNRRREGGGAGGNAEGAKKKKTEGGGGGGGR